MVCVGLIADTHGLLRPQAIDALRGCDHILHAGDIGDAAILEQLSALAPLTAVRGNNDRADWADRIPERAQLALAGHRLYLLHNLAELELDPLACGYSIVVSGHSHRPQNQRRGGVLYVNPGSAGPRRFNLPVSVARLLIDGARVEARLLTLGAS
jgi:putative phosphoesterase